MYAELDEVTKDPYRRLERLQDAPVACAKEAANRYRVP